MATIKDYQHKNGSWAKYDSDGNFCNAFQIWQDMQRRCKEGGAHQKIRPTYVGCSISQEFLEYQFFANWCNRQIGYALQNYQIDKDILHSGNKIYHPDLCAFVPAALNSFFTFRTKTKESLPHGVHLDSRNKFKVTIRWDGKLKYLARCNTVEEARQIYKDEKERLCKEWAERCLDGEFLVDPRVILALQNWKLEE